MPAKAKLIRLFGIYAAAGAVMIAFVLAPDPGGGTDSSVISHIPSDVGNWEGRDLPFQDAQAFFNVENPEGFIPLVRVYTAENEPGSEYRLNALEDVRGGQRDIHDPRFCYTAAGWTVLSYEDADLSPYGVDIRVKLLTYASSQSPLRRMEIYGYMAGDAVFTSEIRLRLAHIRNRFGRIFGTSGGRVTYLGLSSVYTATDARAVRANLSQLMARIVSKVVGEVSEK